MEQVKKPDRSDGREGHSKQDNHRLDRRTGIEVEQQEDDKERDGNDQFQTLCNAFHELVLTAPHQLVAGRDFNLIRNCFLGITHIAANISA